jgi:hypothetical protein
MTREPLVSIVMWGSVILAVLTLLAAAHIRPIHSRTGGKKTFGYFLLAFWALAPATWFFFEWVYLVDHNLAEAAARISHSHDLGRNVWLAYIAVLASTLGAKWPLEK